MIQVIMEKLLKIFNNHNGYAKMQELRKNGVQTRTIAEAIKNGVIEKIKPGLYKLVNYEHDEHESFVEVCHANKRGVICMLSAARTLLVNPSKAYFATALSFSAQRIKPTGGFSSLFVQFSFA